MQLGEIISDTIVGFVLICFLGIVFALFGKPLYPHQHPVRMVVLFEPDAITTASTKTDIRPMTDLATSFDAGLARPRPVELTGALRSGPPSEWPIISGEGSERSYEKR